MRGQCAPESQTLIVWSHDPETILVPSGENATELISRLWASVFSLTNTKLPASQASMGQFWPRRGDFEGSGAPESQTLMVLSIDPDTILVPSGENATDRIQLLCAFVFLLSSSRVPAIQASRRQFWPRRGDFRAPRRTRIPDFDRPISRSGYNFGPVRGERNRHDVAAVRVRLLAQQLPRACQTSQQASVLAKEGRL